MNFNALETLCLSFMAYYCGKYVVSHCRILREYFIPIPIVGGVIFALFFSLLKYIGLLTVKFDMFFFDFFMSMFFVSIGFAIRLNKKTKQMDNLMKIVVLLVVLIVAQNGLSIFNATVYGFHPLFGICTGSVPMVGGFGSVGVFGQMCEELGAENGVLSGMIMAILGLVFGGMIGSPMCIRLMKRYGIKGEHDTYVEEGKSNSSVKNDRMMKSFCLLALCMGFGYEFQQFANIWNIKLPVYAGGIGLAVILGNIMARVNEKSIPETEINLFSDMSLNIFLAISLMSLDFTIIGRIALPVITCMLMEAVFMVVFCHMVFYVLGKSYLTCLFIAGLSGFGLGALPTGMANVNSIVKEYGVNRNIYLLLPLASSIADLINGSFIVTMINVLK